MSMKKVPIGEADNRQLLDYAQQVLGLDVKAGTSTTNLIAKIREASPDIAEILVVDMPSVPVSAQPAPRTNIDAPDAPQEIEGDGLSHRSDPKVKIMIPKVDKPGGDQAVPVSVNGYAWLIQRDVWIPVPYRVYEALTQAWESVYEQKWPGGVTAPSVLEERRVLAYPFQHEPLPEPEVIAAWRARTADVFAP